MEGNWDVALAGALLNVVSYAAFLFSFRALLIALYEPVSPAAGLFPLLSLLAVPILGEYSTAAYDHMQLFLFTLGLLLIAARRDRLFLAFLPIGMLNKETTILLPLVFLVSRWPSREPSRLLRTFGLQLATCVAVFAATLILCRHHPGELTESHWSETLRDFALPSNFFRFSHVSPSPLLPGGASLPVPVGWNLPAILLLGVLIAPGWHEAKPLVRRGLLVVLAPLLLFGMILGVWWELRDYLEAIPLILLAVYAGMRRIWEIEPFPGRAV
jgi:hypothetical protein